jgi:hypothetical protein
VVEALSKLVGVLEVWVEVRVEIVSMEPALVVVLAIASVN